MNVQINVDCFSVQKGDDNYFVDRERKRLLVKILFESNAIK